MGSQEPENETVPNNIAMDYLFSSSLPPESLIHLVEVLGSHSIQAAELKQVIGALRPLEDRQLVGYAHVFIPGVSLLLPPPSLPSSPPPPFPLPSHGTAHLLLPSTEGTWCNGTQGGEGGESHPTLLL